MLMLYTLKKIITDSAIQSFEVGVRYLMYHGLVLMILPQFYLDINPFHVFFRLVFFYFQLVRLTPSHYLKNIISVPFRFSY